MSEVFSGLRGTSHEMPMTTIVVGRGAPLQRWRFMRPPADGVAREPAGAVDG